VQSRTEPSHGFVRHPSCSGVISFGEQLRRAGCGGEETMNSIPSATAEQFTRALGEAVIRSWSSLPQAVQHHLFEAAVKSHGESIRSQLAIFLHDKHPRTSDPSSGPREMIEPDSLGG